MITLLGAKQIREIASHLSLKPTKKLGQNFVIDANTCRKIVELASIGRNDVVLEIGPGLGSLTLPLLEKAAKVYAVEIDQRLANQLPLTMKQNNAPVSSLIVLNKDAVNLTANDFLKSAKSDLAKIKVVANLPYNVSVPVIINLFEQFSGVKQITVMVQTEVARRLAAQPNSKDYGAPSVKISWWSKAQLVSKISRNVFWPVPNVDSSIIQLTSHEPLGSESLRRDCFKVIDLAFATRRKMLRSALSSLFGSVKVAESELIRAGIDPTSRGEALGINEFIKIAKVI